MPSQQSKLDGGAWSGYRRDAQPIDRAHLDASSAGEAGGGRECKEDDRADAGDALSHDLHAAVVITK